MSGRGSIEMMSWHDIQDMLLPGLRDLNPEFTFVAAKDALQIEILGEKLEITRLDVEQERWKAKFKEFVAAVREKHGIRQRT